MLTFSWCFFNLFFFFKQKTAYEMRISDWSSDVCSSDMPGNAPEIEVLLGIANQAVTGEDGKVTNSAVEGYSLITVNGQEIRGENSMAGFEEDDIVPVLSFLSDIIGIGEVGLGGAHDRVWQWYAGPIATQIGRASCRERECQ